MASTTAPSAGLVILATAVFRAYTGPEDPVLLDADLYTVPMGTPTDHDALRAIFDEANVGTRDAGLAKRPYSLSVGDAVVIGRSDPDTGRPVYRTWRVSPIGWTLESVDSHIPEFRSLTREERA